MHLGLEIPRVHILSKFIDEYKPLGERFMSDYGKTNKECYFVEEGVPLVGFGRALAVATFLYDFDCVGNSGGNMGYVIKDGKASIVKIDAGEALPFFGDTSGAEGLNHSPDTRDMIMDTGGTKISFEKLSKRDK